jgi:hypothetical protein
MQRNFFLPPAKVFFCAVDDPVPMKHGVVQQDDLFQDLPEWDICTLQGVCTNRHCQLCRLQIAFLQAHVNLQAAVAAALLLLSKDETSPHITWPTFYNRTAR